MLQKADILRWPPLLHGLTILFSPCASLIPTSSISPAFIIFLSGAYFLTLSFLYAPSSSTEVWVEISNIKSYGRKRSVCAFNVNLLLIKYLYNAQLSRNTYRANRTRDATSLLAQWSWYRVCLYEDRYAVITITSLPRFRTLRTPFKWFWGPELITSAVGWTKF